MLEVAHDDRQRDFRPIDEILDDELKKMEKLSPEAARSSRSASRPATTADCSAR
jgi:hypothetical protein